MLRQNKKAVENYELYMLLTMLQCSFNNMLIMVLRLVVILKKNSILLPNKKVMTLCDGFSNTMNSCRTIQKSV